MKCHGNTTRSRLPYKWKTVLPPLLTAALLLVGPLFGLAATAQTARAASGDCVNNNDIFTCTYTFTGAAQSWTVPSGITQATFDLYGAQGSAGQLISDVQGAGGLGARAQATLAVSPGATYQIMVGGAGSGAAGGFNGGGQGGTNMGGDYGGGGGGAADVRSGACAANLSCTLADRRVVAGGGGGGGAGPYTGGSGGSGGQIGGDGAIDSSGDGTPGLGGTATSGGAGGAIANFGSIPGAAGQLGTGGAGGNANCGCDAPGGGGGGLYGGGGAGGDAGGGGGSSDGPAGTTFTAGANSGDGRVVITYGPPIPDTTPPVITPNVAGTLGQNGWYIGNVAVTWTVSDPDSTPTTTGCGAQSVTSDTTGVTFTCAATSAGGSASKDITIKRDATKPSVVSSTPARAPNTAGWYNAPLQVTFAGSDATSGIAACTSPTYSGPDGAAVTVSGTCTDNAGNTSAPVTFGLNYDATKPIVVSATPNPLPNAAGWYNAPVTVAFAGSDATSGIAACASPIYSGPDSAGTTVAGTCTDNAGNTSSSVTFGLKYDATAPTLTPTVAPNPASLNGAATASPNATDATSGVASASCAQPDTSSAGAKSVACTAADNAGNTATAPGQLHRDQRRAHHRRGAGRHAAPTAVPAAPSSSPWATPTPAPGGSPCAWSAAATRSSCPPAAWSLAAAAPTAP